MRGALVLTLALVTGAADVAAQGGALPPRGRGRIGGMVGDTTRPDRARLEQAVGARIEQMLRNQLGLTDAQIARVREVTARYAPRRHALLAEERQTRMALRQEVVGGDTTRQAQVAELMDRLLVGQRQRMELLEQEQRELAGVLTPLQRAAYLGIDEQIRQRLEGMRGRGGRPGMPPDGDAPRLPVRGRANRPPAD